MGQAPFPRVPRHCGQYEEGALTAASGADWSWDLAQLIEEPADSAQDLRLVRKGACPISVLAVPPGMTRRRATTT